MVEFAFAATDFQYGQTPRRVIGNCKIEEHRKLMEILAIGRAVAKSAVFESLSFVDCYGMGSFVAGKVHNSEIEESLTGKASQAEAGTEEEVSNSCQKLSQALEYQFAEADAFVAYL